LSLKQEIVLECNGGSEVRVWMNASEADPSGTTKFVLQDVDQGREIVNMAVNNPDLPIGSWYAIPFDTDWESLGKFYLLTIASDTTGPQIAYSLRAEYPAGKLFENDQPMSQDMIFQTGCVAGWDALRHSNAP